MQTGGTAPIVSEPCDIGDYWCYKIYDLQYNLPTTCYLLVNKETGKAIFHPVINDHSENKK